MPHDDEPGDPQDEPAYRRTEEITQSELRQALTGLPVLGNDTLRMQAFNLTIVDQFLMQLEFQVLQKLVQEERTPVPEAALLSALSQMWVFAAYELMRTWGQRVRDILKWSQSGGLVGDCPAAPGTAR
jgi:hypothetical protein